MKIPQTLSMPEGLNPWMGQGTGLCPDLFPDTNLSPCPSLCPTC